MACVGDVQKPSSNRMWWEPNPGRHSEAGREHLRPDRLPPPSLHRVLTTAQSQHATRSLPVTSPVRGRYAETEEQQ